MHPEALAACRKFKGQYLREKGRVLDVGSFDREETLRKLFQHWEYVGIDTRAGPNVDIQVGDFWEFDGEFDAVISSSAFEHDPAFWVTIQRMARALRPRGYLYICAPSTGRAHKHPIDCWRFLDDAWPALAKWADLELLEFWTESGGWKDKIGVFRK